MLLLLQSLPTHLEELARLGSAGLMGAMWLWERRNSRQREQQLDEAHARILADRVAIDQVIAVVRQNAEAMSKLATLQEQMLGRMDHGATVQRE